MRGVLTMITKEDAPWIPKGYALACRRVRGKLIFDRDLGKLVFIFDKLVYDEYRQSYMTRIIYNSLAKALEDFDESAVKRALRGGETIVRKRVA
ncbi:MAG: hypothetical protein QXG35_08655, partial [Nitrososphaerota archaeon]